MVNTLKKSKFLRYIIWMKPTRQLRDSMLPNIVKALLFLPLVVYGFFKYVTFFTHPKELDSYKYDYAIVAIVKNEAPYIKEWIEYHKKVGFQKFYIYNNNSTDNIEAVLSEYIKQGIVDLINYPGEKRQCFAYNDAVEKHRYDCKYIAALDLDEFPSLHNYSP